MPAVVVRPETCSIPHLEYAARSPLAVRPLSLAPRSGPRALTCRTLGDMNLDADVSANGEKRITDPFGSTLSVPVPGGRLLVGQAGPAPVGSDTVVLAIHGIASNLMAWSAVSRLLMRDPGVTILAPDLRGRGENTALPGPYGLVTHVLDMLAVLDHLGVRRAVLAGHSMGAYIAARIAAEHPERVTSLVLVDGGLPVGEISDETAAAAHALIVGPAIARHALTFTSDAAYLEFWRLHPAFRDAWNDDVEAYVLHDLGGPPGARRYHVNVDAVEADGAQVLRDPSNQSALEHANMPIHLLRAERGVLDDESPLVSTPALERFVASNPAAEVELVSGVNHYTVLIGEGPGPERVAAVIDAAARAAASA